MQLQKELHAKKGGEDAENAHVGGIGEGDWARYEAPSAVLQRIAEKVQSARLPPKCEGWRKFALSCPKFDQNI